jgi:hypothetical protein
MKTGEKYPSRNITIYSRNAKFIAVEISPAQYPFCFVRCLFKNVSNESCGA